MSKTDLPLILKEEIQHNKVVLSFDVSQDLDFFKGHFKKFPIVPGVVQVYWASECAKIYFKKSFDIVGGAQIKFTKLIQPNHRITLELVDDLEKKIISYKYEGSQGRCSSGKLTYDEGKNAL